MQMINPDIQFISQELIIIVQVEKPMDSDPGRRVGYFFVKIKKMGISRDSPLLN